MPIVRILIVLLALASPALAQDGPRDAAAVGEAARMFRVYVEGVAKKGERPDLTRPETTALLGRVFDVEALGALPPAKASDMSWLMDWMDAAKRPTSCSRSMARSRGRSPILRRFSAT
ncbi:hypothetical protein [Bradyrhizobium sp. CCBAU 65884]|uniref:hypothetical protein n=1 Tax=Bradyrhizobium sp. CCBAU 65884 TaxID=722477 RepID=UPI0023053E31|nr:hypothetical protein [Bradyrhizobium sp. CCBAU 65884]